MVRIPRQDRVCEVCGGTPWSAGSNAPNDRHCSTNHRYRRLVGSLILGFLSAAVAACGGDGEVAEGSNTSAPAISTTTAAPGWELPASEAVEQVLRGEWSTEVTHVSSTSMPFVWLPCGLDPISAASEGIIAESRDGSGALAEAMIVVYEMESQEIERIISLVEEGGTCQIGPRSWTVIPQATQLLGVDLVHIKFTARVQGKWDGDYLYVPGENQLLYITVGGSRSVGGSYRKLLDLIVGG